MASHAVLFGERGVGKTSLARTIFDFLDLGFDASKYHRALVNSTEHMTFDDIWRTIFRQLVFDQSDGTPTTLDEALPENPNSENIRETFQRFDDPTIVIIDELDRITDQDIRVKLADTIKTVACDSKIMNQQPTSTLGRVMVSIAIVIMFAAAIAMLIV